MTAFESFRAPSIDRISHLHITDKLTGNNPLLLNHDCGNYSSSDEFQTKFFILPAVSQFPLSSTHTRSSDDCCWNVFHMLCIECEITRSLSGYWSLLMCRSCAVLTCIAIP